MRHELDAREYKLLLNPERFSEATSEPIVAFWEKHMKPLIDSQLGLRNDDEPRHEGQFNAPAERTVRFWDTADCILTRADLALRERLPVESEGSAAARPEITLKLRMPDLFVVAAAELPGSRNDARTTFEEDIAPLEVDDPNPNKRSVVVSAKRSIRSRFSLSTSQTAEWSKARPTLDDLQSLFPTLRELLGISGAQFDPGTALINGPNIRELVFKGARVKLGANSIGKFALTLWYLDKAGPAPRVAEVSFKCATLAGDMPGKAARRALTLFTCMQSQLSGWVTSEYSSKTALALPRACGRPFE
ncbi:hypothetical protein [Agrobacterium sp. NPDC090283]|uniref:hypothetical protein n=1 Tax=Agrobacterium sp. NPDC090283 TaxID=3363920 RepID=UPI00383A2DC2